jgi:predicted ATPase
LLPVTIGQALGLERPDATSGIEGLTAFLRAKTLLLVLDNFEHLLTGRDVPLHLLEACPMVKIMSTSREPLRVRAERVYPVEPLRVAPDGAQPGALVDSPAVQLFLQRTRAAGATLEVNDETVRTVGEICRRVDGLPLAIELAAAWTPLLPPATLLTRLEHRLQLLAGGWQDLPPRQKTMRDTVVWSYDLLSDSEQGLFRRLSVFVGGCSLEAAEAVCSPDSGAFLPSLQSLVSKSLLVMQDLGTEGSRLRMLETVREYALELVDATGESEMLRGLHARYYLSWIENAAPRLSGPEQIVWVDRVAREHDNLRNALRWACERDDTEIGFRLAAALWRFWWTRGHLTEGRAWLDQVLRLPGAERQVAPSLRISILGAAARLAIEQSDFEEGAELADRCLELAEEQKEPRDMVLAFDLQGLVARRRDRYSEAVSWYERALTLARELGDEPAVASALNGLGVTMGFMGDWEGSALLAQQALAAYRRLGNIRGIADAVQGLSMRAGTRGAYEEMRAYGEEALTLNRALGQTGQVAEILFTLGTATGQQGDFDRASALLEESLAIRQERGDELGGAQSMAGLAGVAIGTGDLTGARALLTEAREIVRRYDHPWGWGMVDTLLAHVELESGNPGRAEELLAESRLHLHAIGNVLFLPWVLEGLAGAAAVQERWVEAAALFGAWNAMRDRGNAATVPVNEAANQRRLATTRDVLGAERFSAAYEEGYRRQLDELATSTDGRADED